MAMPRHLHELSEHLTCNLEFGVHLACCFAAAAAVLQPNASVTTPRVRTPTG
jgi:hypothetical protein